MWKTDKASSEKDRRFGGILCYARLLRAQIKLPSRKPVHTVERFPLCTLSHTSRMAPGASKTDRVGQGSAAVGMAFLPHFREYWGGGGVPILAGAAIKGTGPLLAPACPPHGLGSLPAGKKLHRCAEGLQLAHGGCILSAGLWPNKGAALGMGKVGQRAWKPPLCSRTSPDPEADPLTGRVVLWPAFSAPVNAVTLCQ